MDIVMLWPQDYMLLGASILAGFLLYWVSSRL